MTMHTVLRPALLLGVFLSLTPQSGAQNGPVAEKKVRSILNHLASDSMAGRDTPSPQLEQAADWLAARFEEAGLEAVVAEDGFFHRYSLTGRELDSTAISVKLHPQKGDPVELVADVDVRLWRGGSGVSLEEAEPAVFRLGREDARLTLNQFGRKPKILEVADGDPVWEIARARHASLGRIRKGSMPVLLVPEGKLPKGAFTLSVTTADPTQVEIPLRNVVGLLRGAERPGEFVIVSAHYDHIGIGAAIGGDRIYNGADDDATGTTAVVCIAEALAAREQRPARSILFVCFSGEEKGLRGSRAFAEKPPIALEKVVANVNIEMIGRPPDGGERQAWVTGASLSDFEAITRGAFRRRGIEVIDFAMAGRLFFASDNASLARKGVVAHSISAGTLHRDYHKPSDQVDKIAFTHMTAVINGLVEVVAEFADREAAPAWTEAGTRALERWGRPR